MHFDSDRETGELTSENGDGTDIDTLEKENINGTKCFSEITHDDIRAMEFIVEEEAIQFYIMYACFHGFVVRKDHVMRNHENKIVVCRLLSNKEGKSEWKNKKNEDKHMATM